MSNPRNLLVLAAVAAAVLGRATPALADTTIGQASASSACSGPALVFESGGGDYAVPSGTWKITSWSTLAGSPGGQMAAVVFRPTGTPGTYTIVGTSDTETLTASTLNTFSTSLTVQGGDILGMWEAGTAACDNFGAGTVLFTFQSKPSVGDSISGLSTDSGVPNISAVLSPLGVVSAATPASVFVCYSKWEQDGGAVFPSSQLDALLAVGWWLPVAVPGTVEGGANLGAYHLVCNPPGGLTVTGTFVDDGGQVLGQDPGVAYAIETGP